MQSNIIIWISFLCGLAALLAVAAAEVPRPAVRFTAARTGSAVAPPEFLSQPGLCERGCGFMCSHRPDCFGFYWLLGACRLFHLQAFYDASAWVSTCKCDVFVLDFKKLPVADCSQSSTSPTWFYPCNRAIDGNTSQSLWSDSCSHTQFNASEWWETGLTAPSLVSFVTIHNRQDCCAERLNKFDLLVDGSVCNQVRLSAPFSVANFTCGAFGSRVRVVARSDPPQALTICEFMAYGFF